MIRLEQVQFKREQRNILTDIHMQVNPGENWVILGKNGSGKTTILEMIAGYLFPSSGRVEVLGHVYGQCDIREVRRSIGYISQSLLEKMTLRDPVWEIVASGELGYLRFYEKISDELTEKALHMLEQVKLAHVKDQPLGTLSQGERKKVMLARALMADPRLLILDEPCAGLDLYEREQMLASIQALSGRNIGLIYVTHHMEEIVPVFTHVALLEEGRLVATGPKRSVLTPDNLTRAYQVPIAIEWERDRPWVKVTA